MSDPTPKPARQMPKFTKPPEELAERFRRAVAPLPGAQQRQMFGMPAAFVGGQMFTGLFGPDWFIRLDDDGHEEMRRLGGRPFEVMPGRQMSGYSLVPPSVRDDERSLAGWLRRSLEYAAGLPPKPAKQAKKAAKGR